jgi:hypothetical protein
MVPFREVKIARHTRFAMALILAWSLASNVSQAWTVLFLCPEEYPGPPDCFPCQIFGDTSALDDDPQMTFYAAIFGSTYGHFDEQEGYNLYFNHYHCPADFTTRWVDVGVIVQIAEIPALNADYSAVTCTGGGGV